MNSAVEKATFEEHRILFVNPGKSWSVVTFIDGETVIATGASGTFLEILTTGLPSTVRRNKEEELAY